MSTCPPCINTSCPKPADITMNITNVSMTTETELFQDDDFSGTEVTLASETAQGFEPQVYVNGVLQASPADYSISGDTVTFTTTLVNDVVKVIYVGGASA